VAALFVDTLAEWVFSGVGQAGLALALLAVALYWRRALGAGRTVTSWGSRIVFATAAIGALLLAGVIPGLDLARAAGLLGEVWEWLGDLWPMAREWLEGLL